MAHERPMRRRSPGPEAADFPGSADALRERIVRVHAVRLHCALILVACFGAGLLATKLLLMAGIETMWIRYAIALFVAYAVFLLGVRIWLRYAGFDVHVLPRRRDGYDFPDLMPDNVTIRAPSEVFRGGGGRSGGGGASMRFDGGASAEAKAPVFFGASSPSSSSGGGAGLDLDDGLVLLALIAVALAVSGAVIYLIWAAPTILAEAAFAALLSAGLVRSTRRIASGDWMTSVIGNTWVAFGVVSILAIGFAVYAQHVYPDARTLADVVRHLRS